MSRPAKAISATSKVRLNLEVPERVRARIEALQSMTESDSMTEVIRRALALYDVVVEARSNGQTLLIRDADGTTREMVVL